MTRCNYRRCPRPVKAPTATGVRFASCDDHLHLAPATPSAAPDTSIGHRVGPARRWTPQASLAGPLSG